MVILNVIRPQEACSKRKIGYLNLFDTLDEKIWETAYFLIIDKKYAKKTRNFSRDIVGNAVDESPAPIYVIPRVRGGPSYLSVDLIGVDREKVQYCPISKGFSMQDVSSFTLGPVVGEGLCLVNAAFSKSITVAHIEGGGCVDYKRKNFWRRPKTPQRNILQVSDTEINVDGVKYITNDWLLHNKELWFSEWEHWRKSVALCSKGDFHWCDNMDGVISYLKGTQFLDFVEWKKECYIRPSYELLPHTEVYKFLHKVWFEYNIPLGLVHPKGSSEHGEEPITPDFIRNIYDSPDIMCCQPYVVAGKLLNVDI